MNISDVKYSGQFYEAEVPNTFDIAERAALGIQGIAGSIDPDRGHTMWFYIRYDVKKPYMLHTSSDISNAWKLLDDISMMRQICGSDEHLELEKKYRAHALGNIKDGLIWDIYDEKDPRPWRSHHNDNVPGNLRYGEDFAISGAGPRAMQTMQTWQQIDRSPVWDRYAEEIMDGFLRIALTKDDYIYLPPDGGYGHPFSYPASGWISTREPLNVNESSEGNILGMLGFPLLGCAMWNRFTGDPKALDIARRSYNFIKQTRFWGKTIDPNPPPGILPNLAPRLPDPVGIAGGEMGHWNHHLHAHARSLRGILEYGMASGDLNAVEFVKRAYEYSWSLGIPRVGWINCFPGGSNMMEGCAMGGLIALAIKLSETGVGDYWDDVDSIVRNILAESQYTREDIMQEMSDNMIRPHVVHGTGFDREPGPGQKCDVNVLKRTKGSILSLVFPDHVASPWIMHCCTGNGLQGFYYAWEGAVRENGDSAQVNLLFNRASKGLDVDSWLPYQGKVVIKNKSMKNIAVRIPGWTDKKQVKQFVNNRPVDFMYAGNYICFTGLSPRDEIKLELSVPIMTNRYTVSARTKYEKTYTVTTRGSTVVDISPRRTGEGIYPMFLRDEMKTAVDPGMKKIRRYVPDKTVTLW